ncbi:MAG TPA: hypothetical protein VFQ54_12595 [Thermomicrobiales bacterium]|nr:hypothetical protein [Thermomicrobiales bacterium]
MSVTPPSTSAPDPLVPPTPPDQPRLFPAPMSRPAAPPPVDITHEPATIPEPDSRVTFPVPPVAAPTATPASPPEMAPKTVAPAAIAPQQGMPSDAPEEIAFAPKPTAVPATKPQPQPTHSYQTSTDARRTGDRWAPSLPDRLDTKILPRMLPFLIILVVILANIGVMTAVIAIIAIAIGGIFLFGVLRSARATSRKTTHMPRDRRRFWDDF